MQLDYSLCNNVHDSQYGHYTQRNWLCWLMAVRGIIRIYGQVFITWKPSHDCYFTVFLTDDVLLICVISSRDQLNSLPILAHHRYFFLHDITVYSFCTCNAMIYLQHIKNVHVLSSHEVSSAHHKKKKVHVHSTIFPFVSEHKISIKVSHKIFWNLAGSPWFIFPILTGWWYLTSRRSETYFSPVRNRMNLFYFSLMLGP